MWIKLRLNMNNILCNCPYKQTGRSRGRSCISESPRCHEHLFNELQQLCCNEVAHQRVSHGHVWCQELHKEGTLGNSWGGRKGLERMTLLILEGWQLGGALKGGACLPRCFTVVCWLLQKPVTWLRLCTCLTWGKTMHGLPPSMHCPCPNNSWVLASSLSSPWSACG